MHIQAFFHDATSTLTYVASDPATGDAVVIDPVLDFDARRVSVGERSNRIAEVQAVFADLLGFDTDFSADGSQWDALMQDGVVIEADSLSVRPIATPGHTPACTSLLIGDALFTGDALFMPDFGTGGREMRFETTIGEARSTNKQLQHHTPRSDFVDWRTQLDATLAPPGLIFQSLAVNSRAGHLPEPDANSRRYLRLPIGMFD
jgi:glyoxylase-like metal-dependent hydrolase (beta-lactamase superfamily II)